MNSFDNGRIQIFQGDCLQRLQEVPDNSIDLVLTDPPYGTTRCSWDSIIPFDDMWKALKRVIKPNAAIVLFCSQPFTSALVMSNPKWFKYEWIWLKNRPVGHLNAKKMPLKDHENVAVFCEGKTRYYPQMRKGVMAKKGGLRGGKSNGVYGDHLSKKPEYINDEYYPTSPLTFPAHRSHFLHPNQKPVPLLEYIIQTYTQEDDRVLDFTSGSFSTAIAAINTNRQFTGIELDKGYFLIGLQRVTDALLTTIQTPLI